MRPTNYGPDILVKAQDYIENYRETYHDMVPTVVGLCKVINRSKATVYNWAKDDDKAEFLDILKQIEETQHNALVNGGLSSQFNPAITKMMMTKHGYSDKAEVDLSSSDGTMTPKGINDFYAQAEKPAEE